MPRFIYASLQTDNSINSLFEVPSSTVSTLLDLTSNFTYNKAASIQTILTKIDIFSFSLRPARKIVSPLVLTSNFSFSKLNFNPILPTLSEQLNFVIEFPEEVHFITLPAPNFGDSNKFKPIVQSKYTRGSTLIRFSDPSWGTEEILDFTFSYLTNDEKERLLLLFRTALGQVIFTFDHYGVERAGIILTPESEAFQPVPNGFSVSFQIQVS